MAIINDIKQRYTQGNTLTKVIFVNVAVFLLLRLIAVIGLFGGFDAQIIVDKVEFPSNPELMLRQPWAIITYMFAHYDLLHFVFNMLWLYWFGFLFLECNTPKQLFALYIFGGIGGAVLFAFAYNFLPALAASHSLLIGASAAIIAIVIATAMMMPNYEIRLLFIGGVAIKWIALITVLIDLISLDSTNFGGHIAHLGGALVGVIYATAMKHGCDITAYFNSALDWIVAFTKPKKKSFGEPIKGKSKPRQSYSDNLSDSKAKSSSPADDRITPDDEREIDIILGKIKQSGYAALSDEEKRKLFQVSKKK